MHQTKQISIKTIFSLIPLYCIILTPIKVYTQKETKQTWIPQTIQLFINTFSSTIQLLIFFLISSTLKLLIYPLTSSTLSFFLFFSHNTLMQTVTAQQRNHTTHNKNARTNRNGWGNGTNEQNRNWRCIYVWVSLWLETNKQNERSKLGFTLIGSSI
jgi:uncharacterized protein YacL